MNDSETERKERIKKTIASLEEAHGWLMSLNVEWHLDTLREIDRSILVLKMMDGEADYKSPSCPNY